MLNNINCISKSGLESLIKNSALKLAETNLLQQAAATQGGLVGLQTAAAVAVAAAQAHQHQQQQEIAAKRIRFACPQLIPAVGGGAIVSSAPALIPIVNHQQLIQPPPNNNTNSIIQQQQQMLSTFHHHQQVAAMAAAAATAAANNHNNNLQTSPKDENGIPINENGRNDRINGTGGGELINDYARYGDPTKFSTNPDGNRLIQTMNGGPISQSYQDLSSGVQNQPNSILRIIIECMLYPVTLDVLFMIFSRFGKVLRIITFNKNNSFQALIQLSESSAAMNAKSSLDGLNIYNGCCTLRIEFSKLNTLNVKYNNDKSRDYTNPNLPSGELTYEQKLQLILQNTQLTGGHHQQQQIGALFPFGAAAAVAAQQLATNVNTSNGTANTQFPFNGQMALQPNNELLMGGGQLLSNNLTGIVLNTAFQSGVVNTPVVLVSNLDEATVTPEQLFILFGVYGDVIRVKILFNKKDNALIQYSDVQQAQLAIQHLDKLKWNGRNIRVTASKHTLVQMPKEGQPDAGLTKEFTNSSLHRFKKPGSKNYMNIYPPCATLHLSNIPNCMDEDSILEIFKDFKIAEFKFFQKDHKMALVQLEDVETAVAFLVAMHNYKLAENAHLRVSFSKKGMN